MNFQKAWGAPHFRLLWLAPGSRGPPAFGKRGKPAFRAAGSSWRHLRGPAPGTFRKPPCGQRETGSGAGPAGACGEGLCLGCEPTGRGGAAAAPAGWVVGLRLRSGMPAVVRALRAARALSNKPRLLSLLKWRSRPWPGAQLTVVQKREIGTSFSDRFASFKGLIIYTSKSTGAGWVLAGVSGFVSRSLQSCFFRLD